MNGAAIEDVDYYAVLDVKPEATTAEITRAYRMRSLKVHPDRNPDNPQAAQLFHELRIAFDVLADPTQKASFDALLAARNAKKARFASLDNKRKAMAEDLDRRERDFKRQKEGEVQERNELQRLKEEGRRMREEREKVRNLDREKESERITQEKEEEKKRSKQREKATRGVVELGELDTTVKFKWVRAKYSNVLDSVSLEALIHQLLPREGIKIDSTILSSKFLANPTKGKHGSGVVALGSLSAAVKLVEASSKWDGIEVSWAAGHPPEVLGATFETDQEAPEPPKVSSIPASLLVNPDEEAVLARLRAREREKMMEEMRRQEEEDS